MKKLKIEVYRAGEKEPAKTITMPLTSLHISLKVMPQEIKSSLETEGVDLNVCSELNKEKSVSGILIEIENSREKLVISVEGNNS